MGYLFWRKFCFKSNSFILKKIGGETIALEMELSPVTEEAFKKYFRELLLEQVNEIRQDEMKSRPYLNKKDMAAWLVVSINTLDIFIKAGLKVSDIYGSQLIGNQTALGFLKDLETY